MTLSGSVTVRAMFTRASTALISKMVWESVSEALTIAATRIEALQHSNVSQVPIDTGLLRSSFKIGISPGQIIMHWSALDKGFDYALVADVGRPGTTYYGRHYSDDMREQARQIVYEELMNAMRRKAQI